MITKLQFKETEYYKQHTTKQRNKIMKQFNSINQDELKTELRTHFRGAIYDKISIINGIDPETILEGLSENAQVYLIYIDDSLVYLQTHDPFQIGNVEMSIDTIEKIMNRHIDRLVDNRLMNKLTEKIDQLVKF